MIRLGVGQLHGPCLSVQNFERPAPGRSVPKDLNWNGPRAAGVLCSLFYSTPPGPANREDFGPLEDPFVFSFSFSSPLP